MNQPTNRLLANGSQRTLISLVASLVTGILALATSAQELVHQEGFNDDGEKANPPRYTTTGREAFEVDERASLNDQNQRGPVYWAHNFEVSFVGIPEIPARRMIFTWNGANDTSTASEDFFKLFESSVKWLVKDKANAVIVVAPAISTIGGLADRLTAAGYTVTDDDPNLLDEDVPGDLFIHTADTSRFARIAKPVIVMNGPDMDDMIVGSIGSLVSFAPGPGEIATPGHPAAGGKTGEFTVATGDLGFNLNFRFLPQGAITLATVERTLPPAVTRLADVDEMIAGTKPASKSSSQVTGLDLTDSGSPGQWFDDNAIPGGATGNWGLHAKGKLNVTAAGTYSVALGSDDGARLQIDTDKNGFAPSDIIIEDFGPHGHLIVYANVTFPATGVYDFQIISFNSGTFGSLELSVSKAAVAGLDSALDSGEWDLVGAADATSPVQTQGAIEVDSYVATGASTQVKEPLIVLLNGPDDVPPGFFYGGGAFDEFEGTGFFAASGLNKWDYPGGQTYRSLRLRSVDVTGKKNVKLTVALAGSQIDTEDSDFLDIYAYPNGASSTPVRLAHFRGVENAVQPWMADQNENFARRLTRHFADFVYDIPTNAAQLIIEFRVATSWWNELAAFDNVRITADGLAASFQLAGNRNGVNLGLNWTGGQGPFLIQTKASFSDIGWIDLLTTTNRAASIPMTGSAGFFRVQDQTIQNIGLFKSSTDTVREIRSQTLGRMSK